MASKELKHQVVEQETGRIDVLVARLTGFARSRVRGLVDHGGVRLNDNPCADAGARIAAGDVVTVVFDPARKYREKPVERATHGFTVVYSDEHLVVVNKEPGILTVPTSRGERQTLVDLLSTHLGRGQRSRGKVSVVHRLDRDTSGLLVFGRTPAVAKDLIAQFAAHKPEREYAAIVAGEVAQDKGTIRSHLATDKALNQRSVDQRVKGQRGELAITHYDVQARYGDATLVAVKLETGRRNQIRVHFSEMGHPILGDVRYRAEEAVHRLWPHKRLALHARVLGFRHPITKKILRFEAALPKEFGAWRRR